MPIIRIAAHTQPKVMGFQGIQRCIYLCSNSVSKYDKDNERAGVWYRKEGLLPASNFMDDKFVWEQIPNLPEEYVPPRYFHSSDTCALL